MTSEKFKIAISQATLEDLQARLAQVRWPDEVEGAGWDYGTNLEYLKSLVAYWGHEIIPGGTYSKDREPENRKTRCSKIPPQLL